MNSITLSRLQRAITAREIEDRLPLLVTSQRGATILITRQFSQLPGATIMSWSKARMMSASAWKKALAHGPVVITVFRALWFKVELYETLP